MLREDRGRQGWLIWRGERGPGDTGTEVRQKLQEVEKEKKE